MIAKIDYRLEKFKDYRNQFSREDNDIFRGKWIEYEFVL